MGKLKIEQLELEPIGGWKPIKWEAEPIKWEALPEWETEQDEWKPIEWETEPIEWELD